MVVSTEPLTNLLPSKCKHRTSPEWPVKVITDHGELVLIFQTRMVLSWLPLTMRPESNWTQEIAAEWPSKVRTWHWPEKNHFLEGKKVEKKIRLYLPVNHDRFSLYLSRNIALQLKPLVLWCLSNWTWLSLWESFHSGRKHNFCQIHWESNKLFQKWQTCRHRLSVDGSR